MYPIPYIMHTLHNCAQDSMAFMLQPAPCTLHAVPRIPWPSCYSLPPVTRTLCPGLHGLHATACPPVPYTLCPGLHGLHATACPRQSGLWVFIPSLLLLAAWAAPPACVCTPPPPPQPVLIKQARPGHTFMSPTLNLPRGLDCQSMQDRCPPPNTYRSPQANLTTPPPQE